jgi:hypothetical protein
MTTPKGGRPLQFPDGIYVTTKLDRRDVRRIDRYLADHLLSTRAEAIRELLHTGLDRAERASGAVAQPPSRSRSQPWPKALS